MYGPIINSFSTNNVMVFLMELHIFSWNITWICTCLCIFFWVRGYRRSHLDGRRLSTSLCTQAWKEQGLSSIFVHWKQCGPYFKVLRLEWHWILPLTTEQRRISQKLALVQRVSLLQLLRSRTRVKLYVKVTDRDRQPKSFIAPPFVCCTPRLTFDTRHSLRRRRRWGVQMRFLQFMRPMLSLVPLHIFPLRINPSP